MAMKSPPCLSSDIIFEILTRTQLQTLGNCRLVSKAWNAMTYESSFTQLHNERTPTITGYFVQGTESGDNHHEFVSLTDHNSAAKNVDHVSLDFMPTKVEIIASCKQGLMYCKSKTRQSYRNCSVCNYYVCKPSTRQFQQIPNPKTKYHSFSDHSAIVVTRLQPLDYKIVRLSKPNSKYSDTSREDTYNYRCEVFDSETLSWKTLPEQKLPGILEFKPVVQVSGAAHWIVHECDLLLKFNIHKETWMVSPLPKPFYGLAKYGFKLLLEYEGRIAFAGILDPGKKMDVDVWVKENEEWKTVSKFRADEYPMDLYNKYIMVGAWGEVRFHKLHDRTCNVVKLRRNSSVTRVLRFQSDLEHTNLKECVV